MKREKAASLASIRLAGINAHRGPRARRCLSRAGQHGRAAHHQHDRRPSHTARSSRPEIGISCCFARRSMSSICCASAKRHKIDRAVRRRHQRASGRGRRPFGAACASLRTRCRLDDGLRNRRGCVCRRGDRPRLTSRARCACAFRAVTLTIEWDGSGRRVHDRAGAARLRRHDMIGSRLLRPCRAHLLRRNADAAGRRRHRSRSCAATN